METLFNIPVGFLVLAFVGAGARFLNSTESKPTLMKLLSTVVCALLVVLASYPYMEEQEASRGTITLLIGVLSYFSKTVIDIVASLLDKAKADPIGFFSDLVMKLLPGRRKDNDGDK